MRIDLLILVLLHISMFTVVSSFKLHRVVNLNITVRLECISNPTAEYSVSLMEKDPVADDRVIHDRRVKLVRGRGEVQLIARAADAFVAKCLEPYLEIETTCTDETSVVDKKLIGSDVTHTRINKKYCVDLSECPECVGNDCIDNCTCKTKEDHCVFSDNWTHVISLPDDKPELHCCRKYQGKPACY
ncbi:hypothetical protein PRIPAC_96565 [Pristionchus pacificus]|uniref:Uncharacterized protein n=1 Tax=Pristionchus pacificus TaxID=54126 RepID=A0A2A6CU33_PRIPA|nr:hypothetical protein PRIPAC_96565 [Pristionchus pacificus]|eukprot:PDM81628.1 hypothetical protein PRIPAC_30609 [Pristionchus pacificus]